MAMLQLAQGSLSSDSEEDSPPTSAKPRMESPALRKPIGHSVGARPQTVCRPLPQRDAPPSDATCEQQKPSMPPSAVVTPSIRRLLITEERVMNPDLARARKNTRNLVSILKDKRDKMPRNILLVGQPGHGKSALVNLLHSALRERYEAIAEPGDGYTESHTNHLLFFENFGLNDEHRLEFLKRCGLPEDYRLPTLIDMPGFVNNVSIIHDIIDGLVLPQTDLRQLMKGEAMNVPEDEATAAERVVDCVVFVASIKKDPSKVMQEVFWAVNGCDGDGRPRCSHILVVTHIDKASDPRSDEENALVGELVKSLQLGAAKAFWVQEVSNYNESDPVDSERCTAYATILKKQADGLEVLCKVLSRGRRIEPSKNPAKLKRIVPTEANPSEENLSPKVLLVPDNGTINRTSPYVGARCSTAVLWIVAILIVPLCMILYAYINVDQHEVDLLRKNSPNFSEFLGNLGRHCWQRFLNQTKRS